VEFWHGGSSLIGEDTTGKKRRRDIKLSCQTSNGDRGVISSEIGLIR